MKIKSLGKALSFRGNFLALVLIAFSFSASAQVYQTDAAYGRQIKRYMVDTTLIIPTVCGVPTLRSVVTKKAAIAFDSCNHKLYFYDPKTLAWDIVAGGVGPGSTDTTYIVAGYGIKIDSLLREYTISADSLIIANKAYVNNKDALKQNLITLTTTGTSGAATKIGDVINIPNYAGGGGLSRFGIEDNTGVQNRTIYMKDYGVDIVSGDSTYINAVNEFYHQKDNSYFALQDTGGVNKVRLHLEPTLFFLQANNLTLAKEKRLEVRYSGVTIERDFGAKREIVTSVNNTYADSTGNVTIAVGGSGLDTTKIPLSGTVAGKPVTGDIRTTAITALVSNEADMAIGISANLNLEDNQDGGMVYFEKKLNNKASLLASKGDTSVMIVTIRGVATDITNGVMLYAPSNSSGFRGGHGFTPNITNLDYTQKIYVDRKADSLAKTLTRVGDSIRLISKGGVVLSTVNAPIGGGGLSRFGIEDNTGVQNRAVNMNNNNLEIINSNYISLISGNPNYLGSLSALDIRSFYTDLYVQNNPSNPNVYSDVFIGGSQGIGKVAISAGLAGTRDMILNIEDTSVNIQRVTNGIKYNVATSVNGNYANNAGNVTIPVGVIVNAGIFTLSGSLTDYADDAAAATGGIPVTGLYRTGSIIKIRVL